MQDLDPRVRSQDKPRTRREVLGLTLLALLIPLGFYYSGPGKPEWRPDELPKLNADLGEPNLAAVWRQRENLPFLVLAQHYSLGESYHPDRPNMISVVLAWRGPEAVQRDGPTALPGGDWRRTALLGVPAHEHHVRGDVVVTLQPGLVLALINNWVDSEHLKSWETTNPGIRERPSKFHPGRAARSWLWNAAEAALRNAQSFLGDQSATPMGTIAPFRLNRHSILPTLRTRFASWSFEMFDMGDRREAEQEFLRRIVYPPADEECHRIIDGRPWMMEERRDGYRFHLALIGHSVASTRGFLPQPQGIAPLVQLLAGRR